MKSHQKRGGKEYKGKGPRRESKETPQDAPTAPQIKIEKKATTGLTMDNMTLPTPVKPEASQPAPKVEIKKPVHQGFTLEMSPEALEVQKQRKIARTFTIEEMKAQRHNKETTGQAIFQFHAELQLYKRFMINGGQRRRAQIQMSEAPVLQHRINSLLLRFNVNTFQSVFNEICSLGINSDVFVLSFVNVVFKQAVLNPPLAVIFSLLAKNIIYVQKHTRFAEKMKSLFRERCTESFVVPKAETDKSTVMLLLGIVQFAGHMIRDEVVKPDLLTEWSKQLLAANTTVSLRLLIDLLLAGGIAIFKGHEAMLQELADKMKDVKDEQLIEHYSKLTDLIKLSEPVSKTITKELSDAAIAHSPSMDTSLDGEYKKLFKKSESIPASLQDLAEGLDEDEDTIEGAVSTYFLSTNAYNFITTIESLGYKAQSIETAIELLKAIISQPEQNHIVVTQLAVELIKKKFYDAQILKDAMKSISKENPEDEKIGDVFARIFAILVHDEYATFDEFETMFDDMKNIWKYIVPKFLFEIENMKGEISDDLNDSDFWHSIKFIDEPDTADKVTVLGLWNIINFFPEYEAISKLEDQKSGAEIAKICNGLLETITDKPLFIHLLLEFLIEIPEAEGKIAISGLKQFLDKNKQATNEEAAKLGEKAQALLK